LFHKAQGKTHTFRRDSGWHFVCVETVTNATSFLHSLIIVNNMSNEITKIGHFCHRIFDYFAPIILPIEFPTWIIET
jgi:hypothetical protein